MTQSFAAFRLCRLWVLSAGIVFPSRQTLDSQLPRPDPFHEMFYWRTVTLSHHSILRGDTSRGSGRRLLLRRRRRLLHTRNPNIRPAPAAPHRLAARRQRHRQHDAAREVRAHDSKVFTGHDGVRPILHRHANHAPSLFTLLLSAACSKTVASIIRTGGRSSCSKTRDRCPNRRARSFPSSC